MNNDLISREALKKAFEKVYPLSTNEMGGIVNKRIYEIIDNALTVETSKIEYKAYNEGFKDGVDQGIKLSERPQGEWIPVSERLPEESLNSVIGWDAYRERCVFVQYIDGHFQITGSDESFNIIAWQPLPELYKKGGKE